MSRSVRKHLQQAIELIDQLRLKSAQVVAITASGLGLEMHIEPDAFRSVALSLRIPLNRIEQRPGEAYVHLSFATRNARWVCSIRRQIEVQQWLDENAPDGINGEPETRNLPHHSPIKLLGVAP